MPGYKWVPYTGMRATLPGMICAGRDADGASLVVGRAIHNGDVLPAKAKPEHAVAYVAYGGQEHEKRQFEILMPADFHWVADRNGQVPYGAVESGTTNNGEKLYVGRGYQQGTPTVGKIHPSHGCLYVPFGGREVALREYEVLVQM
ncbi:natterin-3-like [Diprion similis]|uniref:natterin-3-like n=1 Tax=Diprion similis TaxID=362088 RepID=UPI001EF88004|nr:natterin-3-like [Diprion similis]